jgi:hypothetical protein
VSEMRAVVAIARADFLERVRRYSFLFTLGFALYLGYLATAGNLVLQVGNMRGIFNSAWIGALLALVATDFISLAGFYFVKNTIERDRETRVGQILAATPISKFMYAFGKMASNLAVLSLMLAVLAAAGIAMQLISGEDRHIELWKLIAPFVLLAFPAMAVTAAIAVFFETIPFLRGGFGNVAYFFLWIAGLSVPLATGKHAFDLMGLSMVADSARAAAHLSQRNGGVTFSLAFGQFDKPVSLFHWDGLAWTADIIALRIVWLAFAVGIVAVSALLFDRFDPSRRKALREAPDAQPALAAGSTPEQNVAAVHATAANLTPLAAGRPQSRFLAILTAELRLMLKGQKWWWYAVAAGLAIASGAAPSANARGMVLAFAWIWPVLLWSSMGVRETREQTYQLIFSAPHPVARQLSAVWLAGVLVALLTGCGFGLRLSLSGNMRGAMAWLIGALFIPTFALSLGVWSGTGKPFEILYTLLWYIGPLHAMPTLDFMGSAPATAATRYPLMYLGATGAMAVVALGGRKRQLKS